jgi:hypothetical protein
VFKWGRYNPEALLHDDGAFATHLAQDYVRALANYRPTLFIVRECQNIDPESLRFLLMLGEETSHSFVICEYTTGDGQFSADHEKIILEAVVRKDSLAIFDLLRLGMSEFRFLLRKYAPVDKKIEAAVELGWDGNLRIIKELKYRIMVGRKIETSSGSLLAVTLRENLELLSKRQRLVLAIIAVHVESIGQDTLFVALKRVDPTITTTDVALELANLSNQKKYVRIEHGQVSLADEDLLEAIITSSALMPMLRIAETSLRDLYLDVVRGNAFANVRLLAALRQAIALCAQTGDVVALRGLIKTLDSAVREAYDQTLYVNIVAEALLSRQDLSEIERHDLVEWASGAAYEVSDFPAAVSLLEALSERGTYETALLACCYGEINRHEDALTLSRDLRARASNAQSTVALAALLIECQCLVALGRKREARTLHAKLRNDTAFANSPLFGFVLRYTEMIEEFPACSSEMTQSVEFFRVHGFRKSAAYSRLAVAMYSVFKGQLETARELLAEAETELVAHVRDRQIILNNKVVVALLSPEPDLPSCIRKLDSALFSTRDDFSRLVLQNNLMICYWLLRDFTHAIHCAEIMESILRAPAFGDRGVFWSTCFNAWKFFAEIGSNDRAEQFKAIPIALGFDDSSDESYWRARFGLAETAASEFDYLMRFKYHPEYLSHWLIDLEGLEVLKGELVQ